ncbi:hypothetical protein J6590_067622 [Homalodisca vitripennis]|nr:hypothetical protein J6590_067622 [Homalodisca vitripennis]
MLAESDVLVQPPATLTTAPRPADRKTSIIDANVAAPTAAAVVPNSGGAGYRRRRSAGRVLIQAHLASLSKQSLCAERGYTDCGRYTTTSPTTTLASPVIV